MQLPNPSQASEVARQVDRARHRGDHLSVVALASKALELNKNWTRMALQAVQAERRTGNMLAARLWVERAAKSKPDDTEACLIKLESSWLGIIDSLAFDEAVDCANQILLELDSNERAQPEIRWLATRVLLSAASYYALSPQKVRAIRRTLGAQQSVLSNAGFTELSHDVARERAASVSPRHRFSAWRAVANLGERDNYPVTIARATLRQAIVSRENDQESQFVTDLINQALHAYNMADYQMGLIEVKRELALLAIERDGASLGTLQTVVDDFIAAGEPAEALLCLADLASRAQERGDRKILSHTYELQQTLADKNGLRLFQIANKLVSVELANRRRDDALARDICDEVLGQTLPPGLRASFLAVRGSAHAFAGHRDEAIADRSLAISTFVSVGHEAAASDIVAALASNIASTRFANDIAAADRLLVQWEQLDFARGDRIGAVRRGMQRADLRAIQVMGTRIIGKSLSSSENKLIGEGLTIFNKVDRRIEDGSLGKLTFRMRRRLHAESDQWRSNLLSLNGDVEGMKLALERAATGYVEAALPLQAANCRNILGCFLLNLATAEDDLPTAIAHAADSQTHLRASLAYYDTMAGMRVNAAEAHRLLAMLYLNFHERLPHDELQEFLDEAEVHLELAANDLEAVRRDYSASTRLGGLEVKARLAAEANQVDKQALRLHMIARPNSDHAWRWVTRSKARALVDLLGLNVEVPPTLKVLTNNDAELAALISEERSLTAKLNTCSAIDRRSVAADVAAVRNAMACRPELVEYLSRRTGGAPLPDDLDRIGERAPADIAFVDWSAVGDSLYMLIARPGEKAKSVKLAGTLEATHQLIQHSFGTSDDTRRALTSGASQLNELGAIVAPLAYLTRPGEHLILCPTNILQGLPFQLLDIDGKVLLERNPLSRTPSLGLLRIACERSPGENLGRVAVFGDPSSDRSDARVSAELIATALKIVPRLGSDATAASFEIALAEASLILYQGHATHVTGDPLSSHFLLADGARLDVRKLLELSDVACRTMVIGACEGGRSDYRTGDEPLGLLAALLVAGVASVTAADWAVHAGSARALVAPYTQLLLNGGSPIKSLQEAALAVREDHRYHAPYHWGAFTVHGDPWRPVVTQEREDEH